MTRVLQVRFPSRERIALVLVLLFGVLVRFLWLLRPGYSPDEEITYFAVRGIDSHGLPILPSGVMYDRGIAYSYLAWAAGQVLGHTLVAYRLVGLFFGVLAILVMFRLGCRLGRPRSALLAALLLALCPAHIVISQWARPYAAFFGMYLVGLLLFVGATRGAPPRRGFTWCVALSRLLHEGAATLALLPAFQWLTSTEDADRRRSRRLFLNSVGVLAIVQGAIYVLHQFTPARAANAMGHYLRVQLADSFIRPPSPIPSSRYAAVLLAAAAVIGMVALILRKQFRAPSVFLALAGALTAVVHIGSVAFLTAFGVIVQPARAAILISTAAAMTFISVCFWSVFAHVITRTGLSFGLAWALVTFGLAYPTAALKYFMANEPAVIGTLVLVATVCCVRPGWLHDDRVTKVFLLLALAGLVLLGVLKVGFAERYVLWIVVLGIVLAVPLFDRLWSFGRPMAFGFPAALAMAFLVPQYHATVGLNQLERTFVGLSPITVNIRLGRLPQLAGPRNRVICNDELACLYFVGRVDYWLALSASEVSHFSLPAESGRRGLYGGAPVLADRAALMALVNGVIEEVDYWIVLVNSGKFEYGRQRDVALNLVAQGRATRVGEESEDAVVIKIELRERSAPDASSR